MPGGRRSVRNRGGAEGAREEEGEVTSGSGSEAEIEAEPPAPEPEGSEDSFATGAGEEGTLLDRLLARVAAGVLLARRSPRPSFASPSSRSNGQAGRSRRGRRLRLTREPGRSRKDCSRR
eukprot:COSAG05_NODE_1008_length_6213_cov_13.207720_2_plen_120_part_00